jgi:hypothetical protein
MNLMTLKHSEVDNFRTNALFVAATSYEKILYVETCISSRCDEFVTPPKSLSSPRSNNKMSQWSSMYDFPSFMGSDGINNPMASTYWTPA